MRALQATFIQFDHNCPQYSVIDVATAKTSSRDVAGPRSAAAGHTYTHKTPMSVSFIDNVGSQRENYYLKPNMPSTWVLVC